MADNDLEIRFGASLDGLEAGTAAAKAQLQALSAEAQRLSQQMIASGAAGDQSLVSTLKSIKSEASNLKSVLDTAGNGLASVTHGASVAGAGVSFYTRELRALGDEAASGRWRNFDGTLLNLAVHGAQSAASFAAMNPALTAAAAGVLAAGAALGYFVYESVQTEEAINRLQAAAAGGQFKDLRENSQKLREEFASLAGVSKTAATEILADYSSLGEGGPQLAKSLIPVFKALAQAQGKDVPTASKELLKSFADLNGAGLKYMESLHSVTGAELQHYQALVASGQRGDAVAMIITELGNQYAAIAEKTTRATAEANAFNKTAEAQTLGMEGVINSVGMMTESEEKISEETQRMASAFSGAADQARVLMNASDATAAHLLSDADKIASSVDRLGSESRRMAEQSATLTKGLASATQSGDIDRVNEYTAALKRLNDASAINTQKRSDPLGIDRDLLRQDEDALKSVENEVGKTRQQRLQEAINLNRQQLQNDNLTAEQRFALQQKLATSERQLDDTRQRDGTKSAKDELSATMEGIQSQIAAIESSTTLLTEHYAAEVKLKKLTEDQKVALTTTAIQKEVQKVDELYAHELQLSNLTLTQKAKIAAEETALNDRAAIQLQAAQDKAAEATEKTWDSAMKSINGAFDSQINGLLTGTENWSTAFKKMLADLTEQTIKFFVDWGLQQTENTAKSILLNNAVVAAHTSGDAAMASADIASSSAGLESMIGNALKAIEAFSGQVGAGVAAFLAPILGPAAVPAGAAAAASVVAYGNVYDTGAWSIPHDMVAGLHAGEVVIPQRGGLADGFRQMAANGGFSGGGQPGSSGGDTHVHNWNFNGAVLNGNALAAQIRDIFNTNPSMRPSY